jgi:exosortase N
MRIFRLWPLLIAGIYAVVFFIGLQDYFQWSSAGFILGLIALQVGTSFNKNAKGSIRFFWSALLFFVLFTIVPAKTFLYLSLVSAGLFFAEIFYGRINLLPQLILVAMSPWADAVADLFSFPIRLQLTVCAGKLLGLVNTGVTVQGNMILFNGHDFSVDPACMGLRMIVTALLCGMILLGLYQKKFVKELSGWRAIGLLGIVILLNVVANLFRIICLVQFNILPDNFMHEMMGIVCLLAYVIIPLIWFSKWSVQHYGIPKKNVRGIYHIRSTTRMLGCNFLLAVCMLCGMYISVHKGLGSRIPANPGQVAGYKAQPLPGDVIKLENGHSLVYIKHIPGCYYTEHHPMLCWKGSGFDFQQIEERMMNGRKVYTAILQQGAEKLYTAWWYENGQQSTTSQLDWRWDVFRGAHPYSLVNVTAANPEQLEKEIREIRHSKPFRLLL